MSSFAVSTTEKDKSAWSDIDFSSQVTKWPVNSLMGSAKKRFMVLKAGSISYYENESGFHAGEAPLNSYHLTASSVVKRTDDTIKVEISRGKEAILFRSKGEVQRWVDCLNNTIEKLLTESVNDDGDEEGSPDVDSESKLQEHIDEQHGTLLGGHVVKKPKGGGYGGAKKRYMVLNQTSGKLSYYETIAAFQNGNAPKGAFHLNENTTALRVTESDTTIYIKLQKPSESLEFRAVGQENQWLSAINGVLDGYSNGSLIKGINDLEVAEGSIDITIDSENNSDTGITVLNHVASGYIIKWPTSQKIGGITSRYLEVEGDFISYYVTKGGACKGSFQLNKHSSVRIENMKVIVSINSSKESFIFQPNSSHTPNVRKTLEAWAGIISNAIYRANCVNITVVTTKNNYPAFQALHSMTSKLDFDAEKTVRFNVLVITDPEYNDADDDTDKVSGEKDVDTSTKLKQYFHKIATATDINCHHIASYSTVSAVSSLAEDTLHPRMLQSDSLMVFCNPNKLEETGGRMVATVESVGRKNNIEGGVLVCAIDMANLSVSSPPFSFTLPVYQDDTWGEYGDFPLASFGIPIIIQNDDCVSKFYETGFEEKILYQDLPNMGPTAKDSLSQMELKPRIIDLYLHYVKDLQIHLPRFISSSEESKTELEFSKTENVDSQSENDGSLSSNAY